jgi:predicted porin
MKKTLIALAALAASGAVFAQSSVTLSGALDVGFEKRFSGDASRMTSNRSGTSNWTLSGTEDLGGGLKAVFQISTSFNTDTGTYSPNESGTSFVGDNGMFVGLTGGFGTLRAGRPVNILYGNALLANGTKGVSLHDSNSVISSISPGIRGLVSGTTTAAPYGVYVPNAVQYLSPRFGGVQVQVEFAPSESTNAANNDGVGLAVRYDGGPLSLSLTNYKAASNQTLAVKNKAVTQLGASYNFGVAALFFTYRDQSGRPSDRDAAYALGVTAPVGPGSLYFAYNSAEQAGDDGRTIIAGYKYQLSKRTQAYVNVANRNAAYASAAITASGGNGAKSSNGFGLGLLHTF